MIITKAPMRISFFGGGSDFPDFYLNHGGAVLSTSINKYVYISSNKFFDNNRIIVKYTKLEKKNCPEELKHPIFREILTSYNIKNIEINSNAEIPAGTGLGSSSAFTVALIKNMEEIDNNKIEKYNNREIAEWACDVEIDKLKEPIGKQDQFACAMGGLNLISFWRDGNIQVKPIIMKEEKKKELENNLLMFYTGIQRKASSVLFEQKNNIGEEEKEITLKEMVRLAYKATNMLENGKIDDFGYLLKETWDLKRTLAPNISNGLIDECISTGLEFGAFGAKCLGAGNGGFILFYCPLRNQKKLRIAMSNLNIEELPFMFEEEGAKLIYKD